MTPQRYARLKELFVAALECEPAGRAALLARLCGDDSKTRAELEQLIHAHDRTLDVLATGNEEALPGGSSMLARAVAADVVPAQIGRFRIQRVLGEGGMGVVYEAEQEHPRRTVALKVIRPGLASAALLRRFEHEAQVLGRLAHPGIAQIFEAGTADAGLGPQPFFAMELVRGRPLTEFARERQLGLRERLALLADVCDAVEHAHQKGVIHRDLKPANILVVEDAADSGAGTRAARSGRAYAKILDFGVARVLDADLQQTTLQTSAGQLIGTIPYMSPEQVGGDPAALDTRSDVYALGVLLFELLAGRLPYELSGRPVPEAVRIIASQEPARLGSLNPACRGDIETIAAHALEKEKERRYGSAAQLAADIRHYLRDEPISARPATAFYQLRKFARRHSGMVAGVATAAVTLVATAGVSSWLALRATRAEALAQQRYELAEGARREAVASQEESDLVVQYLDQMLDSVKPEELGRDVLVRDVLEAAARTIDRDLRDRPRIEARLRDTIGTSFLSLGDFAAAEQQLLKAEEIRLRELGPEDSLTIGTRVNLAGLRFRQGRYDEAFEIAREAVRVARRALGDEHSVTLSAMHALAVLYQARAEFDEAEKLYRETIDLYRRTAGLENDKTLRTLVAFSTLLEMRGRLEEAEQVLLEALPLREKLSGPAHPATLYARQILANLYRGQALYSQAEEVYAALLEQYRAMEGGAGHNTLEVMNDLASIYNSQGRHREADALIVDGLGQAERVLGPRHRLTLMFRSNRAVALRQQGKLAEAEAEGSELLRLRAEIFGEGHPDTILSLSDLAMVYQDQGRFAEAAELLEQAVERLRALHGESHPQYLDKLNLLRLVYDKLDRDEEALRIFDQVLAGRQRLFGPHHPQTLTSLNDLAVRKFERGELDAAAELLREVIERRRQVSGPFHGETLTSMTNLAAVYRRQERVEDALALLREVLRLQQEAAGEDHPRSLLYQHNLARVCEDAGRMDEALELLAEVVERARRVLPAGHAQLGTYVAALGECHLRRGEREEARRMLTEARAILRAAPGASKSRIESVERKLEQLETGGE